MYRSHVVRAALGGRRCQRNVPKVRIAANRPSERTNCHQPNERCMWSHNDGASVSRRQAKHSRMPTESSLPA
jgi:hypothetical protein